MNLRKIKSAFSRARVKNAADFVGQNTNELQTKEWLEMKSDWAFDQYF
jgi:hypothetical protein